MNKEEIYDEKISPLVKRIAAICEESKIATIMAFAIPSDYDDGLRCSPATLTEEYDPPENMILALDILMRGSLPTVRDK